MMSGLIYALALFGCSDDATFCERLADQAKTYESRVACEMAVTLEMDSDLVRRADHPTVIGKCMTKAQLVRLGDGPVSLVDNPVRLAANGNTRPES